jgi:hypothetical protein
MFHFLPIAHRTFTVPFFTHQKEFIIGVAGFYPAAPTTLQTLIEHQGINEGDNEKVIY